MGVILSNTHRMKRVAIQKRNAHMITVLVSREQAHLLDRAVKSTDANRSKFVRRAIRELLEKMGIPIEKETP